MDCAYGLCLRPYKFCNTGDDPVDGGDVAADGYHKYKVCQFLLDLVLQLLIGLYHVITQLLMWMLRKLCVAGYLQLSCLGMVHFSRGGGDRNVGYCKISA